MKWWNVLWQAVRDVVLTCTGIYCIVSQILAKDPNGLLLGTGLALTVPSVAEHVKALLPSSGGGPPSSSPPVPEHGQPPPSSSHGEVSAGDQ